MKRIIGVLALAFVFIFPCPVSSLEPAGKFGVYGGISYIVPQKKFMRSNYDNAFSIINVDFPPVGVELGVLYRLSTSVDLMLDVGARRHILKAKDGLQHAGNLRIFPAAIVARRVWRFESGENPYAAIGSAVYWSRFSTNLIITGELDPTPLGEYGVVKNYFGIGAIGEAGLLERLSEKLYLDLGIRYDFTRLGDSQDGGLGNIGGVQFKLKTIYYF